MALKHRALRLSDQCFHAANMHKIKNILKFNGFPSKLINSLLYNAAFDNNYNDRTNISNSNINHSNQDKTAYKSLVYVQELSESLNNILKMIV